MELMNRELQRKILFALASSYPEPRAPEELGLELTQQDRAWNFNATYLHQHGLIQVKAAEYLGAGTTVFWAQITARGLDFLQDDGGLSAVLNVVTVRLEADTIRALIEDRLERGDVPQEEKSRLMRWLDSAGSEGLSEATRRLVGAALDHAPDVLRLLGTQLG